MTRARSSSCAPTPAPGTPRCFAKLKQADWTYSIAIRMAKHVRAAVEAIDEAAWMTITDYPTAARRRSPKPCSATALVVRRTRLVGAQAELFSTGVTTRLTNRSDAIAVVEAERRQHAGDGIACRRRRCGSDVDCAHGR